MLGIRKRALRQLIGLLCLLLLVVSITGCGGTAFTAEFESNVEVNGPQEEITESTFTWQNPLPSGNPIYDMSFVDEKNGWAVGSNLTILKTTDGKTWQLQNSSADDTTFEHVAAFDKDTAMVFGSNWLKNIYPVLITLDGGQTWEPIGVPWQDRVHDIQLTGNRDLWVLAFNDGKFALYKTADIGKSWSRLEIPETFSIEGMYISEDSTIWLSAIDNDRGGAIVLVSEDGGHQWDYILGDFSDVVPISSEEDDETHYEYEPFYLDAILALDNKHIWLGGSDPRMTWSGGILFVSSDGGSSWEVMVIDDIYQIVELAAVSNDGIWANGQNGVVRIIDNGELWEDLLIPPFSGKVTDIEVLSDKTAYVSSSLEGINKTEDGGKSWQPQFSAFTHADLESISAVSDTTAWAVGGGYMEDGVIFHTEDGGTSWQLQLHDQSAAFTQISAVNEQTAYVLMDTGDFSEGSRVMKTVDSGETWTTMLSPESNSLSSISAVDAKTVWVISNEGQILKTEDGGSTWSTQKEPSVDTAGIIEMDIRISDILAVNSDTAWAADRSGIYNTADGGKTWNSTSNLPDEENVLTSNTQPPLYPTNALWSQMLPEEQMLEDLFSGSLELPVSIYAVDAGTAWIVKGNILLRSTDGGETWSEIEVEDFQDLSFSFSKMLIEAGQNNVTLLCENILLETCDSGATWSYCNIGIDKAAGENDMIGTATDNFIWLVGQNGTILKGPRTLK